ncbi:MAG: hypothetical protein EPO26_07025 [Chloroflexota bacterium]|nr:MAG: hypothetical protein EPO26_07025 [Chloroflexota bacterium]
MISPDDDRRHARPDAVTLEQFAGLGVDRSLLWLRPAGRDEVITALATAADIAKAAGFLP